MKRKKIIILVVVCSVLIIAPLWFIARKANAPQQDSTSSSQTNPEKQETQTTNPEAQKSQAFNKSARSIDDPTSIWVIVNKKRPLPDGFSPNDLVAVSGQMLRKEPAVALQSLLADSAKSGASMRAISGYRSQATQTSLYNSYVAKDGVAGADRYSARPRYSEHQTGLSADLGNGVCDLEICFGTTNAGKWLQENAYKYGFVIRYPNGKESITGYQYEPWHIRFVGTDLANEIQKSGLTLEQFFGLPPAPNY